MEKKKSTFKILAVILSVIIVAFAALNIAWLHLVRNTYEPLTKGAGFDENGTFTVVDEDNYR